MLDYIKDMNRYIFALVALLTISACSVGNTPEPSYTVVERLGDNTEIRRYDPMVLAETTVATNDRDDAANEGFRRLFDYISGENVPTDDIAMTAPVEQQGTKIPMTAPVEQQPGKDIAMTAPVEQQSASETGWVIRFVLPEQYTSIDNAPKPLDERVKLVERPGYLVAVQQFGGSSRVAKFEENAAILEEKLAATDYTRTSDTTYAYYNPPFTPWFLKRNEVLIEVKK